jgi:hypothetical protein
MKNYILLLLILSGTYSFADTTMIAPGKNQLYMNIPNAIGYERQLPFQLYIGGKGIIKIDLVADKNSFNFEQVNSFEIYIYREFNAKYFAIAPIFCINANSEVQNGNDTFNKFLIGLQMYHRFLLSNRYEITPNMRIVQISANHDEVWLHGILYPELRIGLHF